VPVTQVQPNSTGACDASGRDGRQPVGTAGIVWLILIGRTTASGRQAGLGKDRGISSEQDALLGALFFLGYFLFQIPGAWYAEQRSAKRLIFWSLLLWGVLASLTSVIRDIHLPYLDRLLLGVAESVVLPGMLIFLSPNFAAFLA